MFGRGQAIVHPAHGVGIIKEVEQRKIMGMVKQYYVVELPLNNVEKILVPIKNVEKIGIRKLSTSQEIFSTLETLSSNEMSVDFDESLWQERFTAIKNKLKTGLTNDVAYVLKYLFERKKLKNLGMNEEDLYIKAFKFLTGEIMFSLKIPETKAIILIESSLSKIY